MAAARTPQRGRSGALVFLSRTVLMITWFATPAWSQVCAGDCNMDGRVTVNELVVGVNIPLGPRQLSDCPTFDTNNDGAVSVNELLLGVNNALAGCPETCPLEPGVYTMITQMEFGGLGVHPFCPYSYYFPAGSTIVEDVGPGDADCVHDAVVPYPGGFSTPTFCVPALGYAVHFEQTGCGVGRIDSDGGSDFTVTELGDTSDSSPTCNTPDVTCSAGADTALRVDVTVGDGSPDTCTGSGTANAILTFPVLLTVWLPGDGSCPDRDGAYDPGTDSLVMQFPEILDLTTDTNYAAFADIDGDGCSQAGSGPPTWRATGACWDVGAATLGLGLAGIVGSGSPLSDVVFGSCELRNAITGPEPSSGAICDNPPAIDFNGTATRCMP